MSEIVDGVVYEAINRAYELAQEEVSELTKTVKNLEERLANYKTLLDQREQDVFDLSTALKDYE